MAVGALIRALRPGLAAHYRLAVGHRAAYAALVIVLAVGVIYDFLVKGAEAGRGRGRGVRMAVGALGLALRYRGVARYGLAVGHSAAHAGRMVILAAAGVHYHLPRIRPGGQQLIQRLRLAVGAGLLAVGKGLLGRLHRRVLQSRAVGAGVIVPAALLVVHEPGQTRVLSGAVGAGRGPALERIGQRDRNAGIHARAVLYNMVEPLLRVVVYKRAGRIGLRGVLRLSRSVGLRGRGRVGLRGRSSRRLGRAGYERALGHGSGRIGYEQERILVHARRAAERSHGCGVLLAHAVGAGLVARRHRMLPGVGRRALGQAAVGRKVEAAAGLGVVDRLGPRDRAGS